MEKTFLLSHKYINASKYDDTLFSYSLFSCLKKWFIFYKVFKYFHIT